MALEAGLDHLHDCQDLHVLLRKFSLHMWKIFEKGEIIIIIFLVTVEVQVYIYVDLSTVGPGSHLWFS